MSKKIYMIFYDRGTRAQDNGEHLCRWVMKNHPEIKTAYLLNNDSPDWPRLKEEGFHLINLKDRTTTNQELKLCDYACSSIFNEGVNLNFQGCKCSRIFLNHGCFLVPIKYIKDERNNVDLFIAANKVEYDNLLDKFHGLDKKQVALCGQPRHDNLISSQKAEHEENTILIQFWQRPRAWTENNDKKFRSSAFFKKTKELLSNKTLLDKCRENNIKIVFKMHPIQYSWLKYYRNCQNDIVELSTLAKPFEPEFIRSKLFITDISSNAYEMAKIGKPCIYFEPDPEELFNWRLERNGGFEFNLKTNSIGPVINKSVDKLVEEIIKLIDNNFILEDKYLERREKQISFINDTNSCERCFKEILRVHKAGEANEENNTLDLIIGVSTSKIVKEKVKSNSDNTLDDYNYFF